MTCFSSSCLEVFKTLFLALALWHFPVLWLDGGLFLFHCWGHARGFFNLETEWVSEVAQSCPSLCDPVDCSPPGSSVHGIIQARILEWVAISFSRGSSRPRDRTQVSRIADRRFNLWATREAVLQLFARLCHLNSDSDVRPLGLVF